jgi:hypothetical protein
MPAVIGPNPTDAALLHAGCVESLLGTLSFPATVVSALDTLDALSKRWQTDYDAVVALDAELIPRRAEAGRPAVGIGPHTCTTAHRAGVLASWVLESMVRHALQAPEVYRKDRQRFNANLDAKKPFNYQFAKDHSKIIARVARHWAIPEARGLAAEIQYESALLRSLPISDNDRSKQAEGSGQRRRKKRGSPIRTDPDADKRLCRDWKVAKGQGASRDSFAKARGITVKDLIAAQDRERNRRLNAE